MPRKPSAATLAKRAAEAEKLNAEPETLADEIKAELAAMKPVEKPVDAPVSPAPVHERLDHLAIIDKIKNDEKIMFTVPEDPRGEIKIWERHFNGHVIILRAGRTYNLPKFIVDTIKEQIAIQIKSEETASEYTKTRQGKYLGEMRL